MASTGRWAYRNWPEPARCIRGAAVRDDHGCGSNKERSEINWFGEVENLLPHREPIMTDLRTHRRCVQRTGGVGIKECMSYSVTMALAVMATAAFDAFDVICGKMGACA